MSNLAVAANPPVPTGPAPATAGVSSPTVAPADAAGGRDQVFSFPVTIYATATIAGEIEDEARNTIGCDLRDALADESSVDLENGGALEFTGFALADAAHATGSNARHEASAMLAVIRGFVGWATPLCSLPEDKGGLGYYARENVKRAQEVLARIDGKA